MPDVPDFGYYTPTQTARLLQVHYNTIYLWTKKGKLESRITKQGKRIITGRTIKSFFKHYYQ